MAKVKVVAPTVNLNGAAKGSLIEQWMAAHDALKLARTALLNCMPHGRDFQTAPEGAYQTARDQHEARIDGLADIDREVEEVIVKLLDQ